MKKRHSIIYRVTAYYAGAMILLLLLVFGLLFVLGEQTIRLSSQKTIEDAVHHAFEQIEFTDESIEISHTLDLFTRGVNLLIYDGNGELVLGSIPGDFPASTPLISDRHQTIDSGDPAASWNVYDLVVNYRSTSIWVRGISSSLASDSVMAELLTLTKVLLPVLAGLVIFIGYLITKRAFRPIQSINQTVLEIEGSQDLERRILLAEGSPNEIHTLAENFNLLFARLQERFRIEQQFTSDASHELRTPIAAIRAQAERGLDPRADEDERLHALERIRLRAEGMADTLNQLMLLTRADRKQVELEMESIDFTELCEMVVETYEDEAERLEIQLFRRLDEGVFLRGDQTLLMRLVGNLLSNAIKYNKPAGIVTVDLTTDPGFAILSITDSGIGIAAEHLEHLFDRFYRVSEARGSTRGGEYSAGLGLSIVSWAISVHGGTIDVQSNPGTGTVCIVRLPLEDR